MRCKKCKGVGQRENPKFWAAKEKYLTDYYLRYEPMTKCNDCNGTGFVVGELKDVVNLLERLEVFFTHVHPNKGLLKDVKDSLELIKEK